MPGVYRITCTPTGQQYIGSTTLPIHRRWAHHLTRLRQGQHVCPPLQELWNRYEEEAFAFEVLETVEEPEMVTVREQHYLAMADGSKLLNTNKSVTRPKTKAERGFAGRQKSFGRVKEFNDD
jgi:group I intron endonuclease